MDLPGAEENLAFIRDRFPDKVVVPLIAADGVGMEDFKSALHTLLGL
jgi:hypothetical protein